MNGALQRHLFPGDHDEHGAVIGVTVATTTRGTRLLGRRLYLARDGVDYVPGQRGYRMLAPEFVRDRALDCQREDLGYLAIHCHGGQGSVAFSATDMASHERGYPALLDLMGGQPVGALVFAQGAVAGDIWFPGLHRTELVYARVPALRIGQFHPAPSSAAGADPTYDRQSRLFGDLGQEILSSQKVAVVGVGGAGSLAAEYLARLGVGHLVVIDPQRIDVTNLPRIVGSRRRDARPWMTDAHRSRAIRTLGRRLATPKVRIAERMARQANPAIVVTPVMGDITSAAVAEHLIDSDYIFLAADTAQARLVVNAIAQQYLIPAVQFGVKVQLDPAGHAVTDLFVVNRPIRPELSCLWCNGLISPSRLQEESTPSRQRQRQRYWDSPRFVEGSVMQLTVRQ